MKKTGKPWMLLAGTLVVVIGVFVWGAPADVLASGGAYRGSDKAPTTDTDEDGAIDLEDNCPDMENPGQEDGEDPVGDGVGDVCDNCPAEYNPNQSDFNNNGMGDVCDPDPCVLEPLCGTICFPVGASPAFGTLAANLSLYLLPAVGILILRRRRRS